MQQYAITECIILIHSRVRQFACSHETRIKVKDRVDADRVDADILPHT